MILLSPAIILVSPQMGENIGAAARAMLNFGLTELRLVAPRDGWPNEKAMEMAAGAFEIMPPVRVFATLPEALADLHFVYSTTARTRNMAKPVLTAGAAAQDSRRRMEGQQKTGFVFGPERNGLDNDEIALCHTAVHIRTNPDFPSLNLGQAVLLMTYEWHKAGHDHPAIKLDTDESVPAKHEKLDAFLLRLENELAQKTFFRDEGLKPTMIRNIRAMFMRAGLSDQELQTFHGIVSALTGNKSS